MLIGGKFWILINNEAVDFLNINETPEKIVVLSKIAHEYLDKGQYRIAERVYRRAMLMSERLDGSDDQNT